MVSKEQIESLQSEVIRCAERVSPNGNLASPHHLESVRALRKASIALQKAQSVARLNYDMDYKPIIGDCVRCNNIECNLWHIGCVDRQDLCLECICKSLGCEALYESVLKYGTVHGVEIESRHTFHCTTADMYSELLLQCEEQTEFGNMYHCTKWTNNTAHESMLFVPAVREWNSALSFDEDS